jgi:hypothetical protein
LRKEEVEDKKPNEPKVKSIPLNFFFLRLMTKINISYRRTVCIYVRTTTFRLLLVSHPPRLDSQR